MSWEKSHLPSLAKAVDCYGYISYICYKQASKQAQVSYFWHHYLGNTRRRYYLLNTLYCCTLILITFCIIRYYFQDIDFDGFKIFMDIFLEVETPDELVRHLFLSFVRYHPHPQQPQSKANVDGKTLKVHSRHTIMSSKFIRRGILYVFSTWLNNDVNLLLTSWIKVI